MNRNECTIDFPPDLRMRAKTAVPEETADLEKMSPDEIRDLIYSLRVDRAELELKNLLLREACEKQAFSQTEAPDRIQFEEALCAAGASAERERSQLVAVFQAVSDGIVVADMSGAFVLVNEAEARINGYPNAADMKRDLAYFGEVYEITWPDGSPLPFEDWPLSKVLRGESVVNWELRARRKDTEQEWFFSFSGEPVRNELGEQILAVVITRDISGRKQAETALRESEERLRTFIDNIESIVWIKDLEGRFLLANRYLEEVLGISQDQILGRTVFDLFSRNLAEAYTGNDHEVIVKR
ncbi:MAG: PAS domain-containing protein, partial [Candidatus Latescibacterota bacterium]